MPVFTDTSVTTDLPLPPRRGATASAHCATIMCANGRRAPARLRDQRQREPEHRPRADVALHAEATAVGLHDPRRHGQSQADVAPFPIAGGIGPVERLEDVRQVARRDAGTGIADLQHLSLIHI